MSRIQPGIVEFRTLKDKLAEDLGANFFVEMETEITTLLGQKYRYDLAIFNGDKPIVAIEYKSLVTSLSFLGYPNEMFDKFDLCDLKYGVYFFGDYDEFYVHFKRKSGYTKLTYTALVEAILKDREFGNRPKVERLRREITSKVTESVKDFEDKELVSFINECLFNFNDETGIISFDQGTEDRFFRLLLPKESESKLYRYTSVESLFKTMKDKTFGMCSITCMNDKGELSYADEYVKGGINAKNRLSIVENNNCFITSCCSGKQDDLTMWRFYGQDGKGVCLELEVNQSEVNNGKFILAPVSYGQEKGKHHKLDIVRNIRNLRIDGWEFRFNRWHIWKHFFKSYLFRDEKEHRLVYLSDENTSEGIDWILASENKLPSRIRVFTLDEYPLKISAAIIGPKCPEMESIVEQFNYMNMIQQVIPNAAWRDKIRQSSITDYR